MIEATRTRSPLIDMYYNFELELGTIPAANFEQNKYQSSKQA